MSNKSIFEKIYKSHIVIKDIREYNINNIYDITLILEECVKVEINNTINNENPIIKTSKPRE